MTTSAASPTSVAATATSPGLAPQPTPESLAFLRRAIEKMKALQATERVIATMERVMLNRVPEKFDLIPVGMAINQLNLSLRNGVEEQVQEASLAVSHQLETTLQSLATRDEALMPYHLRRFCQQDAAALDLNALAALTSFYRALPPTEANRGKYDFVVTHLFSRPESGRRARHRHLRISREQVAQRLTEMCLAWGETIVYEGIDSNQISQSIQQFELFMEEAQEINQFQELVSEQFFQRIREFKAQVGAMLYLPEITAVSIESNLVINNRFLTLLEIENEELQVTSSPLQNLADAFGDLYSNEPSEIDAILRELQTQTPDDALAQSRVTRLTNLLQIPLLPEIAPHKLPETEDSETTAFALLEEPAGASAATVSEVSIQDVSTATAELDEELQALAAEPENQPLVMAYLKVSEEARKLNLHSFLSPLPDGSHDEYPHERKLRRVALGLIFQADQLAQARPAENGEPRAELEGRVETLLEQLGQMGDEMRDQIKVAAKYEQNANYEVFLDAYNQLMTTRLRLQSVLVRRNIAEAELSVIREAPIPTPTKVQEAAPEMEKVSRAQNNSPGTLRKWLMVAVVISSLLALAAHFAIGKKPEPKDDADVVRLERDKMPYGELFAEVKMHQDLMICLVTQAWLELSSKEQKTKLQEVFTFGQERGAQRIMLINAKGTTVGYMTKEERYVN